MSKNINDSKPRIKVGNSISPELWFWVKAIATNMSRPKDMVYANKLVEEGLMSTIKRYEKWLTDAQRDEFREYCEAEEKRKREN